MKKTPKVVPFLLAFYVVDFDKGQPEEKDQLYVGTAPPTVPEFEILP